jgi:hypothetical protein
MQPARGVNPPQPAVHVVEPEAPVITIVRPFVRSMTKGNIRVTLLSVGVVTAFSTDGVRAGPLVDGVVPASQAPQKDEVQTPHAIPGLQVVYLVELIGPESNWVSGDAEFLENGKVIPNNFANLVDGGNGINMDYESYRRGTSGLDLPEVQDPNRCSIRGQFDRGTIPTANHIDVTVRAGFGEKLEEFKFVRVSLR